MSAGASTSTAPYDATTAAAAPSGSDYAAGRTARGDGSTLTPAGGSHGADLSGPAGGGAVPHEYDMGDGYSGPDTGFSAPITDEQQPGGDSYGRSGGYTGDYVSTGGAPVAAGVYSEPSGTHRDRIVHSGVGESQRYESSMRSNADAPSLQASDSERFTSVGDGGYVDVTADAPPATYAGGDAMQPVPEERGSGVSGEALGYGAAGAGALGGAAYAASGREGERERTEVVAPVDSLDRTARDTTPTATTTYGASSAGANPLVGDSPGAAVDESERLDGPEGGTSDISGTVSESRDKKKRGGLFGLFGRKKGARPVSIILSHCVLFSQWCSA